MVMVMGGGHRNYCMLLSPESFSQCGRFISLRALL